MVVIAFDWPFRMQIHIDWTSFRNDDLDDISNEMAGIYSAILFTTTRTSKLFKLMLSSRSITHLNNVHTPN
jgi:hypothetical protein